MARSDFYFTRLTYESGDWDVDIRMPSNVLNSLVEYTTLRIDPVERWWRWAWWWAAPLARCWRKKSR